MGSPSRFVIEAKLYEFVIEEERSVLRICERRGFFTLFFWGKSHHGLVVGYRGGSASGGGVEGLR